MKSKTVLTLWENNKKIGYIFLRKEGEKIRTVYHGKIVESSKEASIFNDHSLSRGMKNAKRCFPQKRASVQMESI